jgi:hypothetical protein
MLARIRAGCGSTARGKPFVSARPATTTISTSAPVAANLIRVASNARHAMPARTTVRQSIAATTPSAAIPTPDCATARLQSGERCHSEVGCHLTRRRLPRLVASPYQNLAVRTGGALDAPAGLRWLASSRQLGKV